MVRENMPPHIFELLDGMRFPASKTEIVEYANEQEGGEEVMDILQAMPDRIYNGMDDLSKGMGRIEDLPGTDDGWWPASESASLPDDTQQRIARLKGQGQL